MAYESSTARRLKAPPAKHRPDQIFQGIGRKGEPDLPTGPPEKRADEFVNISSFDEGDFKTAKALMQADVDNAFKEKELKQVRKEAKQRLAQIAASRGLDGFRWGPLACYYRGEKTTKTTDHDKLRKYLIEQTGDADLVEAAFKYAEKESEPWVDLQVKDLTPVERKAK